LTARRRGFGIRLVSAGVDFVFGIAVALLLTGTAGRWFARRAAVMLSIGSPDTFWRGPIPMVMGILGNFVYGLPFALLLVLLGEVFFGAGPGKWLFGMRVTAPGGTPAPARRRLVRWTLKCAGLWIMVVALVLGSAYLAALALGAAVVALAGLCLAIGSGRQALHDRLSDPAVCSFDEPGGPES
jgi:hypothetical protein